MSEFSQCEHCGTVSSVDEWEVLATSDDDFDGFVNDEGEFVAFDAESKARCPACGEVSEKYF